MKPSVARFATALPPGSARRIVYLALTGLAVAAALLLQSAGDRRLAASRDAAIGRAWQSSPPPGTPLSLAAISARFAMRASGDGSLTWQAANAGELAASLRALDASDAGVTQVKVARNGSAGFTVSAERAR